MLRPDSSGNSNDFTPSGTITATNDSPTNDADNDYGNYCTWNTIDEVGANLTISNGNLTVVDSSAGTWDGARATQHIPSTGIWGVKLTQNGAPLGWELGLAQRSYDLDNGGGMWATADTICYCPYQGTGSIYSDAVAVQTSLGTTGDTDVVEMIVDMDAGNVKWYKNSVLLGTAEDLPATTTDDPWFFTINCGGVSIDLDFDFGQLGYDPNGTVAGALALSTANMPTPAIPDPSVHHDVTLVSHNGTTGSFELPTDPTVDDYAFVIKLDGIESWWWFDTVRGLTKYIASDDATTAETIDATTLSSSGTTVTMGAAFASGTYIVEWFKAGVIASRGSQAESGTGNGALMATTYSVNTTSGFSIVLCNGFNDTIANSEATLAPHGMGATPDIMFGFNRDTAAGHPVLTGTGIGGTAFSAGDNHLLLDSNAAKSGALYVQGTTDSTNLALGNDDLTNKADDDFVWYCHVGIEGYSQFGNYAGNAAADGPVINGNMLLGRFFAKPASVGGASHDWQTYTNVFTPYNIATNSGIYNGTAAASGTGTLDILSMGAKLRHSGAKMNAAGTHIYGMWGGRPIQGPAPASNTSQGRAR